MTEPPQVEAALGQEAVDVAKQRLPGVHAVERDLEFEHDDAVEDGAGPAQHVELGTLDVELHGMDRLVEV